MTDLIVTPTGKLSVPLTWQALLVKGLPGHSFQRTRSSFNAKGGRVAPEGDKARAEDFLSQHPREAVSTMLWLFEEALLVDPQGALAYMDLTLDMLEETNEEVPF